MDRRESVDSRLDMLEFRIAQVDATLKLLAEEREETLKILRGIEISQAKITTTIDGGVALTYITIVAAVGWVVQYLFSKFFHE